MLSPLREPPIHGLASPDILSGEFILNPRASRKGKDFLSNLFPIPIPFYFPFPFLDSSIIEAARQEAVSRQRGSIFLFWERF